MRIIVILVFPKKEKKTDLKMIVKTCPWNSIRLQQSRESHSIAPIVRVCLALLRQHSVVSLDIMGFEALVGG